MDRLHTVILPVAGLGTRMLPATKVTPKELLPVYDTPLLQFAIDEALAAGARRIILISHPDKPALAEYFEPNDDLERKLADANKADLLDAVRASRLPDGVELSVVMQEEQLGLGHAVLCAAENAEDGPVGVLLPDDLILGAPCLAEMTEAYDPSAMRSLVAAQEVPHQHVSRYGIFDCDDTGAGTVLPAARFVEKPSVQEAPSRLAAVGRYIIDQAIFDVLRNTGRGAGGEIQLTDAIAQLGGIHAFRFSGERHDCGNRDGLVDATLAVQRLRKQVNLRVAAE
ncbi:UTP--glucose-1-phosphate uridylyltransferase [Jannaschia sp. 2305UL9-9]|uniref:UTP--glucose-1-phosphate uridylyltransferase n=1 Tax=Jannaschia sp. 2305UL9-9 TaxID=3121638 RepID=UPI003529B668